MYSFKEFQEAVAAQIRDYLPQEYANHDISIQEVVKNNDTHLFSVVIQAENEIIVPNIYLEGPYDQYLKGQELPEILIDIANLRVATQNGPALDVNSFLKFEEAKDHIVARLVNGEHNQELFETLPHTLHEDLAVTYHVLLDDQRDALMTAQITYEILDIYGISQDELHAIAMENTVMHDTITLTSMHDTLVELVTSQLSESQGVPVDLAKAMADEMVPVDDAPMYVLSNTQRLNGAIAIMNQNAMDMVATEIGENFYVLPSSIHEVLVVPESAGITVDVLEQMVYEVNRTEVSPQEVLSDHVYYYDAQTHELTIAVSDGPERSDILMEAGEAYLVNEAVKSTLEHVVTDKSGAEKTAQEAFRGAKNLAQEAKERGTKTERKSLKEVMAEKKKQVEQDKASAKEAGKDVSKEVKKSKKLGQEL